MEFQPRRVPDLGDVIEIRMPKPVRCAGMDSPIASSIQYWQEGP